MGLNLYDFSTHLSLAPANHGGRGKARCVKGKSCSATCIARSDDCLLDFPKEIQPVLRKVAQNILSGKGGNITEEESEVIGKNLASLFKLYDLSVTGRGKAGQAIYHPEVAKRYVEFIRTGKSAIERREVSDEELEAIWRSLDSSVRKSLNSKGQPPRGIPRNEARGKKILKLLLETGFRDEATGQPYSWKDLQPDHKVAITFFKGNKAEAEKEENLMITHKGYNGMKGYFEGRAVRFGKSNDFVTERLLNTYERQASRTPEEFEKDLQEAKQRKSGIRELTRQVLENSPLWGKQDWVENVSKLPAPVLQKLMSMENKNSGLPHRFVVYYDRNIRPDYASRDVNAVALLINRGIPKEEWPPGLLEKATARIRKDLQNAQSRSKREERKGHAEAYEQRFTKFTKGDAPPEIKAVFKEFEQ